MPDPKAQIAFVLKGYPRLSETFIAQEILALEQRGLKLKIFSLRHPADPITHAIHGEISAPVNYLPEYVHRNPLRVLRSWRTARRLPGYGAAWRQWRRDLARDATPNRMRRFAQAMVLAAEMDSKIGHVHAHFLHTPASVARYAAIMRRLGWSFSAHARDIWTSPEWELREKLHECAWGVSCTAAGVDYLNALASPSAAPKVALVYHGLDLSRFPCSGVRASGRDGRTSESAVRLISVGRAVPKKGLEILLQALALLPRDLHWRLQHVGGGPELPALMALAQRLGIGAQIDWTGYADQTGVLQALRGSDLFALPCIVAPDGDRDGIPNVLMEAQSQELACVSSALPTIAEFILDGETGLLCPPGDTKAFAAALTQLMRDPLRRAQMGRQGRIRLESCFYMQRGIDGLAERFASTGGRQE